MLIHHALPSAEITSGITMVDTSATQRGTVNSVSVPTRISTAAFSDIANPNARGVTSCTPGTFGSSRFVRGASPCLSAHDEETGGIVAAHHACPPSHRGRTR